MSDILSKSSYGFSALFEAMHAQELRDAENDVINNFATSTMEGVSLLDMDGIDVDDEIPTSADDYNDDVSDKVPDDLKALDCALDAAAENDDDELDEELVEEALEAAISGDYEGVF